MDKTFTNNEVAELLRRVSAAYEIMGENRFRISAYDRAAVSVEHSSSEIKDIWDAGKLEEVPGIGKSIADHLDELFKKGRVKHFEKLFKKLPSAVFVFLKIPGVGAKTAYTLSKKLKIFAEENALIKLKKALKEGKLQGVKNFGEKSQEKILKGIESYKNSETKQNRMLLPYADQLAREIISYLKQIPEVLEADPLGSLRRMVSTIGDIDISVSTNNPQKVLGHFFKFSKIKSILGKGETALGRVILSPFAEIPLSGDECEEFSASEGFCSRRSRGRRYPERKLEGASFSGRQVDIRISKPENYGAMLQYFTGSKQHNILLREFSLKKGLSLSEYGIKSIKNLKLKIKNFKDEENFYNFLGLDWIPPELREGTDEIAAALLRQSADQGKPSNLPILVELSDIKGDLHIHSDFPIEPSHDVGESEPKEMIRKAKELGYEYLGFSEHNPSYSKHTKNQIIDLIKRRNEYFDELKYSSEKFEKLRTNKLLKIFNGLEIDIKNDGSLALPDEGLNLLDYAVASVHTNFEMGKKEMTERIIKGLSNPRVKILGHPTGRLLNRREGYELDWDKLFDFCLKNNKILEISSWPERLDLPDILVAEAVKLGVMLVIDSDSHAAEQMILMKYGVSVARRGWAEKNHVINTLPFDKLRDILLENSRLKT